MLLVELAIRAILHFFRAASLLLFKLNKDSLACRFGLHVYISIEFV